MKKLYLNPGLELHVGDVYIGAGLRWPSLGFRIRPDSNGSDFWLRIWLWLAYFSLYLPPNRLRLWPILLLARMDAYYWRAELGLKTVGPWLHYRKWPASLADLTGAKHYRESHTWYVGPLMLAASRVRTRDDL